MPSNVTHAGYATRDGHAPRVSVFLDIKDDIIQDVGFQVFGCGCTIACCSVLTEIVKGAELASAITASSDDVATKLNGIPEDKRFCADIPIAALQDALLKE